MSYTITGTRRATAFPLIPCVARLRYEALRKNVELTVLPKVLSAGVPAVPVQGSSGRYKIPGSFGVSLACR